jgi:hypothetical protein
MPTSPIRLRARILPEVNPPHSSHFHAKPNRSEQVPRRRYRRVPPLVLDRHGAHGGGYGSISQVVLYPVRQRALDDDTVQIWVSSNPFWMRRSLHARLFSSWLTLQKDRLCFGDVLPRGPALGSKSHLSSCLQTRSSVGELAEQRNGTVHIGAGVIWNGANPKASENLGADVWCQDPR